MAIKWSGKIMSLTACFFLNVWHCQTNHYKSWFLAPMWWFFGHWWTSKSSKTGWCQAPDAESPLCVKDGKLEVPCGWSNRCDVTSGSQQWDSQHSQAIKKTIKSDQLSCLAIDLGDAVTYTSTWVMVSKGKIRRWAWQCCVIWGLDGMDRNPIDSLGFRSGYSENSVYNLFEGYFGGLEEQRECDKMNRHDTNKRLSHYHVITINIFQLTIIASTELLYHNNDVNWTNCHLVAIIIYHWSQQVTFLYIAQEPFRVNLGLVNDDPPNGCTLFQCYPG